MKRKIHPKDLLTVKDLEDIIARVCKKGAVSCRASTGHYWHISSFTIFWNPYPLLEAVLSD
ncbi:MAG: hypothetical protein ACFFFC_04795 [Candidatus Thorarchaeota archaeon]